MYLYGFDIGGTKCAVILAKVEGDQVDFLERYEMKTLGDWKKVLDELSENALMIAKKYGLHLQTCAAKEKYEEFGIYDSGCMTAEILGKANGITFKNVKHIGNRAGCQCMESHGIGDYDTCMNGCKYCYANTNPQKAFENYKFHDPDSPLLLGHLKENDIVQQGVQKSMLAKADDGFGEQLELKF